MRRNKEKQRWPAQIQSFPGSCSALFLPMLPGMPWQDPSACQDGLRTHRKEASPRPPSPLPPGDSLV